MATLKIVTSLADTCFYRHYSVWAGGKVYHFNETGAHCEDEATFIKGRRLLKEMPATKTDNEVIAYYEQNKNRRYNWLTYNCEHFATECAMGKRYSPTLRGYFSIATIAIFTGIIIWLYRNKA